MEAGQAKNSNVASQISRVREVWTIFQYLPLTIYTKRLCNWKGKYSEHTRALTELSIGEVDSSNRYLEEVYNKVSSPEDKAQCLKIRSRNKFTVNDFLGGLKDTLNALEVLGITINLSPSEQEANRLFDEVQSEITEMGPDQILAIPRSDNPRAELIMQLLSTAGKALCNMKGYFIDIMFQGMNAYWRHGDGFADVATLSLTVRRLKLCISTPLISLSQL